jgi:outer membrane protein, heavy metal efflux system
MIQVAGREYYPDLTLSGTYSSMFMDIEHQFMVGIEFPIPLARTSRGGAVDEASAEAAGARSGVAREIDAIRREVDVARLRVVEAIHIVHLYRARLIPVARQQIAAARSAYQTGASDFQALISAERNLREVELAHYVAQAELSKRRAQLERTLGQMPGLGGER